MGDVRLVPRTCSTQASQPDSFRPTGDARCCWRWGAKYLRRAGTCPSCLARCDASVEGLCGHPSRHTIASKLQLGKLWAGGGGTVKVAVAVVLLSFFVETARSTEPSIPQGVANSAAITPQYKHYQLRFHEMPFLYRKSPAQLASHPPGYGIGGSEAQRLSCSTDWPPFPGKAISVASEAWRRLIVTSTRVWRNHKEEIAPGAILPIVT